MIQADSTDYKHSGLRRQMRSLIASRGSRLLFAASVHDLKGQISCPQAIHKEKATSRSWREAATLLQACLSKLLLLEGQTKRCLHNEP